MMNASAYAASVSDGDLACDYERSERPQPYCYKREMGRRAAHGYLRMVAGSMVQVQSYPAWGLMLNRFRLTSVTLRTRKTMSH